VSNNAPLVWVCVPTYNERENVERLVAAVRREMDNAGINGHVLVIDDASAAAILAEIDRRRAAQLRDRFDYLSPDESPEQQRHRVLWLQRQGSLDDHEVSARLLQIDLMAQSPSADPRQGERDE
jgi:hypothetical protein